LLLSPFAFFYLVPKPIIRSNPEQTLQNITAHPGRFISAALFGELIFMVWLFVRGGREDVAAQQWMKSAKIK
jgi:hypothetical protein